MSKKIYQVSVFDNGLEEWRLDGKYHRDNDLPAVMSGDLQIWYQHGKIHRDNDLPAITNGDRHVWSQHGKIHRDNDLPADINGSCQTWYQHDKLHRLSGPAFISKNIKKYFIEGKEYSKEEFDAKTKEMKPPSCEGKIVEIDGKKYQLKAM